MAKIASKTNHVRIGEADPVERTGVVHDEAPQAANRLELGDGRLAHEFVGSLAGDEAVVEISLAAPGSLQDD